MLALGRRPLHKEPARPDPPTAGDRPRDRDVGAGARRAPGGPRGAHPDRDPADADALRSGRSQPARGARVDGRARPPGAGSQAHRRHRQAPSRAGAGGGEGGQGRARRGPGAGQEGPLARGRGRHPRGRRGQAPAACARRHIGAGRPVESCGIPVNPTKSRRIPLRKCVGRVPARFQYPPDPLPRSRRGDADGHSLLPLTSPAGRRGPGRGGRRAMPASTTPPPRR